MTKTACSCKKLCKDAWLGSLLVGVFLLTTSVFSQTATASLNGVVKDSSGAVIANASVKLVNLDTNVQRVTSTNEDGVYVIVSILPGKYTLEASANGFSVQRIAAFDLAVGQNATYDFVLSIGAQVTVVTVQGSAPQLDVTSSNLGTVMETKQVNDLPLNGRNFTQLLQLTPGVVPINVSQSSGGGFAGPATAEGSSFTFPAINGQTNRSNFYFTDGLNNYGSLLSTYAVPPHYRFHPGIQDHFPYRRCIVWLSTWRRGECGEQVRNQFAAWHVVGVHPQ
jgi:hypothetical protein